LESILLQKKLVKLLSLWNFHWDFFHPIVSVWTKIGQPVTVWQVWRNAARKLVPADVKFFEVGDCIELNWDRPSKLIVPQQRNCKIEVLANWHGY
jgi:hypothetical protein